VRKGAKAIRILAPVTIRQRDEHGEDTGEQKIFFRAVPVFDVSMTEPLPGKQPVPLTPPAEPITGDSHQHLPWEKLLQRPDIDVTRADAYRWIYKVALHRAWVIGRAVSREQPSGGLSGADDDRPEPAGHELDIVEIVADRVECATVREVLGELHWRERRELLLYAHGLSYQEIAEATGTSYTAVNRWLARGRDALRQARARATGIDDLGALR
jgi:DNA-directed RNA polymerase specialized sigma24 family protein